MWQDSGKTGWSLQEVLPNYSNPMFAHTQRLHGSNLDITPSLHASPLPVGIAPPTYSPIDDYFVGSMAPYVPPGNRETHQTLSHQASVPVSTQYSTQVDATSSAKHLQPPPFPTSDSIDDRRRRQFMLKDKVHKYAGAFFSSSISYFRAYHHCK